MGINTVISTTIRSSEPVLVFQVRMNFENDKDVQTQQAMWEGQHELSTKKTYASFHEEEEGDTSGESRVNVANPPLFQANPKASTRNIYSKSFRSRIRRITLKNHL